MNNFLKRFPIAVVGVLFAILAASAFARGGVTHRTTKDFRDIIVQGERPEIAACMVAALNDVRSDPKFDAILWGQDDSDTARMREDESAGHLLRTVRFNGLLRTRGQGFFSPEIWQRGAIVCEQHDEESPDVHFVVMGH